MKKTCLFVIVCILLSVLLLSCGALTRPMERQTVVELHITGIREYQNSTAGARVLSDVFTDASLTVSITGDYHAEQTVRLTSETVSVSFTDIPAGARIQATASVTTADGELVYTGQSSEIVVAKGINTLAVVIEPSDVDIDVNLLPEPGIMIKAENAEIKTPETSGDTLKVTGVTQQTVITFTVENAADYDAYCFIWLLNGETVEGESSCTYVCKLNGENGPVPQSGINTVSVIARKGETLRSGVCTVGIIP